MMERLVRRLDELAAAGQTITYGDLARELDLPAPSIATLAQMLEQVMEQDAAMKRPYRAAVCAGRLGDGMPSLGFFEKAAELDQGLMADPVQFVLDHRAALRQS